VDYDTGRIVEIGGLPWPYEERKMKFVENWKQAPKWLSMQFAAALGVWLGLPDGSQAVVLGLLGVPAGVVPGVLVAGVILGRLIDQPKAR
jgi:hypothetical protein